MLQKDERKLESNVIGIMKTDDTKKDDEEAEIKIFLEDEDINNEKLLYKCKLIKDRMLPLTMEVTRELYNQCKDDITYEKALQYVKTISKYRKRKGLEDKSEKIANSIVDFLNKNGIIESDEGYEDKYYFTTFGKNYMQYFMLGII